MVSGWGALLPDARVGFAPGGGNLVGEGSEEAIDELMEQPMLASVLESGLAAFDLSCNGIGDLS